MTEQQRDQYLRIVLMVVGIVFIVGIWPLMIVWPAGWQWQPNQAEYEQMILGVLRNPRRLPATGFKGSDAAPEPHFVHRLVQPGARGHHGSPGIPRHCRARSSRG